MPSPVEDPPATPLGKLLEDAWSDLLALSRREMRSAGSFGTDQSATSLLGEATLRVLAQRSPIVDGSHLRGLITVFVRRIIADRRRRSRRYRRLLRGVDGTRDRYATSGRLGEDLAEALASLQRHDERKFMAITLSAMDRLPQDVIASVLGTSLATVERDLRFSRAWIALRLEAARHGPDPAGRNAPPGPS